MKKNKINSYWLKQSFVLAIIGLLSVGLFSCKEKEDPIEIFTVKVKLVYPAGFQTQAGVTVKFENTATNITYEAQTNGEGVAQFEVTAGAYNASASESRVEGTTQYIFNGLVTNRIVSADLDIDLVLQESTVSQLVIKELYNGGCQRDDGSGAFNNDSYVILYNNSSEPTTLVNACFGMVNPYNSNGTNNDYNADGKLLYDGQGWIPAGPGIWYFPQSVTIDPGKQIVVAFKNAIDNTEVYSNSINFNNSEYYCYYDPESPFSSASVYPPPAPAIPTNHYLKTAYFGAGNAWALSVSSPAFFVFTTPMAPQAFVDNEIYFNQYNNSTTIANERRKVQVDWILDAIEVYTYGNATNSKRLTATVDAGYVELRNQYGFTLYRNVDKEATEAIPENEGKIVSNYSLGTYEYDFDGDILYGTTDPSGIDAEASIKNGARIVYKNTNNSSNDFHMRRRASLRN